MSYIQSQCIVTPAINPEFREGLVKTCSLDRTLLSQNPLFQLSIYQKALRNCSFSALAYSFQNSAFTHRYFKFPLSRFKHMLWASGYFSSRIISRIDWIASSYCSFLRISRYYLRQNTMQQSYLQYLLQQLYFDQVLPPLSPILLPESISNPNHP